MGLRITFDLLLCISAFVFPWWLTVIAACIILLISPVYEVVAIGLLLDALYGTRMSAFFNIEYLYTAVFVVFAIVGFGLRKVVSLTPHTHKKKNQR